MKGPSTERLKVRALVVLAATGLVTGVLAWMSDWPGIAQTCWVLGTAPVAAALLVSMIRELAAGRMGVDAVAFVAMTAALVLGEALAGSVVAVMYAGGNVLEDYAVARAERDLMSLVDRAPRIAHREVAGLLEDVPVESINAGDRVLVRGGEVIPVDGIIADDGATIDESAVTGEPIPVNRRRCEPVMSGTVNAGGTFRIIARATAGDSTYAGIVRMVTAAQTAKAPFIRIADRYALLLLPASLLVAGLAWLFSGDPTRGLAVLVAATPCPLILAAPVAFVAGVSRAARRGILIKGGGPLEALARARTVMFDKTGTLTVGGARLVAIETAPAQDPVDVLRLAGSLEQASHHVVAAAIVAAARARSLDLALPTDVRETMGSGLEGIVDGRLVRVGSQSLVLGARMPEPWATRALRRASWRSALAVFVSVEGHPIGALLLGDELRRETPRAVSLLRTAGVSRLVMVTGDRMDAAETIASALDLDAVLADRVPSDKVDAVVAERRFNPTAMVGDGINDAPALAAADVGIAMGAKGASASSQAADVVILVDRLDRVSEALSIARRSRTIAVQSIVAGMGMSAVAMAAAAYGWLSPVAAALSQEAIDIAVIMNALRALYAGGSFSRRRLSTSSATALREDHERLDKTLDRLREIADTLDDGDPKDAIRLIQEADEIVTGSVVAHEREDERTVYPNLTRYLSDRHGLGAMSRAHREIMHQARLLSRLAEGLTPDDADRYLIRDAQRVIESIEALVRIHNAQEEDIYDHVAAPARI